MILILADSHSIHADLVEEKLSLKEIPYLRFETDLYPTTSRFEAHFEGQRITGYIRGGDKVIPLPEISCIWWHSITKPLVIKQTPSTYQSWMSGELVSAIETMLTSLRVPIFPDPDLVNSAGRKWRQLFIAGEVGFLVPKSLLTSDPASLVLCPC